MLLEDFTFQFSDGWWKYDFDKLGRIWMCKHDSGASWSNGGYYSRYRLMGE